MIVYYGFVCFWTAIFCVLSVLVHLTPLGKVFQVGLVAIVIGLGLWPIEYWQSGVLLSALLVAQVINLMLLRYEHLSLEAHLIREYIRYGFQSPLLKGDRLLVVGAKVKMQHWHVPKGYTLSRMEIEGVKVEFLKPARDNHQVILQIHGGAFAIGFLPLYRDMALTYSKRSGGDAILSVDYTTSLEASYPKALQDVRKAYDYLRMQGYEPSRIRVVGDSAGGNLALALLLQLKQEGQPMPQKAVVMSPWADMTLSGASYQSKAMRDPMFGARMYAYQRKEDSLFFAYAADHDPKDPLLSPIFGSYTGFPPMLLQCGSEEVVLSDSETIAQKCRDANVAITFTTYVGMFHMFQLFRSLLPESRAAWKEVEQFLRTPMDSQK